MGFVDYDGETVAMTEDGLRAVGYIEERFKQGDSLEEIAEKMQLPKEALQVLMSVATRTGF